jgi:hypothetical protein
MPLPRLTQRAAGPVDGGAYDRDRWEHRSPQSFLRTWPRTTGYNPDLENQRLFSRPGEEAVDVELLGSSPACQEFARCSLYLDGDRVPKRVHER